jgi:lipopolysaccharide assembly outer membrane protein LptD (OstA)
VPSGTYRITASLPGFSPVEAQVTVAAGQTVQLPLTLRIDSRPFMAPLPPFRQDRLFEIRADQQTRQGPVIQYRGNVRITTGFVETTADEADFNVDTRQFDLRGNVRMRVLDMTPRVVPLHQLLSSAVPQE